jgi:hypothetical protein
MFEFEACEVFKTKDFTFVNDCFKYERNEEIRHYGQTLLRLNTSGNQHVMFRKMANAVNTHPVVAGMIRISVRP